jgi:hypothetical protein
MLEEWATRRALKSSIEPSEGLDLVNRLAHDQNNRRARNKIQSASTLKSSNLPNHRKLPIRLRNDTSIGGRLRKRDCRA